MDSDNPYLSPTANSQMQLSVAPGRSGESAPSELLATGLLYRKIRITAPITAILEFNGRGLRDVIRVDGQLVAWKTSWWRITPRLAFQVWVADTAVPIVVTLKTGPLLSLRHFAVEVAGTQVYAEHRGVVEPSA